MNKFGVIAVCLGLFAPGLALAQGQPAAVYGEGHARSAMLAFGCNSISSLSAGPAGSWHGQCSKGGSTVNVMMDGAGTVTSGGTPSHITEPMARSAMTSAGCNSVTTLSPGPANSWHGQCAKGGATVNAMVDNKGVVTTGQPTVHLTEAHARSALTNAGCSSISTLSPSADGAWMGQCMKGGKLSNVSMSGKGVVSVQ